MVFCYLAMIIKFLLRRRELSAIIPPTLTPPCASISCILRVRGGRLTRGVPSSPMSRDPISVNYNLDSSRRYLEIWR